MTETEYYQNPWNFLGLPESIAGTDNARAWLLPIPYEATTSYGAGTREGPAAILAASRQVELYDHEFGSEPVTGYGVHTLAPMDPQHRSPEAMIRAIEEVVVSIFEGEKPPEVLGILGGEHSISAGIARAVARVLKPESFVTVHVDAHADLRPEYEGSPFSHACAARRIAEVSPIFQVGIRNISIDEVSFLKERTGIRTVFSEETNYPDGLFLKELADFVKNRKVYFTIDLDGLDPSIMPAVGTPEPGGISWERMLDIVRTVCRHAQGVPVFDVVELAPIPGLRAPDFLAAKLVYKVFSHIFNRNRDNG